MSNNNNKNSISVSINQRDLDDVIADHADRLDYMLKNHGSRDGLTHIMVTSMPGMSKSTAGKRAAKTTGRKYFEERAGNLLMGDLRIPGVDFEAGVAKFFANSAFPFVDTGKVKKKDRIIMVWDEFLDASDMMMKVLKQATNDNCIGSFVFPENTLHVAFANGMNHGCHSNRMPLSNANRAAWYELVPDAVGWQDWLQDEDGGNASTEFKAMMSSNLDILFDIDVPKWDGRSNFASFRSAYEIDVLFQTKYIKVDDEGNRTFEFDRDPLLANRLQALVGPSAAQKLYGWLDLYKAVGSIDEILKNPTSCQLPDDIAKKWVVACKLAGEANDENLGAVFTIAERLLGAGSFIEAYVGRSIYKDKPSLKKNPIFRKWLSDNVLANTNRD